jgi:aldose 1-epimerase
MTPPSGEQIEIKRDGQQAIVVEVGGGLRSYAANGRELLDGYGLDAMSTSGRGQVLSPWPNRLRHGSYEFNGKRHQLPLTEPERHNAIHGLVRWSPWAVAERAADRVVVENVIHPQPGYPFRVALQIEYALSPAGLAVRSTATNVGDRPCPYGSGAHPYLTLGTPTIDVTTLCVPAATVLLSDGEGIPTGTAPVEGKPYDFRRPKVIGRTTLDNAFTDLERDEGGIARVELHHEERGVALWMDEAYRYVMVFSGDPLPDVNRRSLAVEPMTCPPNAFFTGEALVALQPGEPFTAAWGISPC